MKCEVCGGLLKQRTKNFRDGKVISGSFQCISCRRTFKREAPLD